MSDFISSIKVSPVPPRYPVPDIGYLTVNAKDKILTIYDDTGNSKTIAPIDNPKTSGIIAQLIDEKLAKIGIFKFKGKKDRYEDLPTDAKSGDVWQVGAKQYVWNGTQWVQLGFDIDTTSIYNTIAVTSGILNNIKADKTSIPSAVSQLINDSGYLTKSCSSFPEGTTTDNVKTLAFCNSLISKLATDGSDVGKIFMGTTRLYDVPLDDPTDPSWETNPKQAELLVKVTGYNYSSYILELQLTSTGSNERSWKSMYFQGNMQYGDSHCPWFANLLTPIESYNESIKCGDSFKKQFRGATQKYVDDKLSGAVTVSNVQQLISNYTETDPVFTTTSANFVTKVELPELVSSLISGYVKKLNENTILVEALSSLLVSKNLVTTIELDNKIDEISNITYQNFDDLLD